jgi:hypothetical protein
MSTTFDGKPSIVNYLQVNNKSYVIFFISESKAFFGKIISTRNTIILFCLIIFLLLAGVSVYISYRVYNPINNIFTNIRNLIGGYTEGGPDHTGDFKFISGAVSKVVERLNNLEHDSATNLNSLKNSFVRNVFLSQSPMKQADFAEGMERFQIFKDTNLSYRILVIRVDNSRAFQENNSKESISFHLGSLESIICETVKPSHECSAFSIDMDEIIILAGYNNENNQADHMALDDQLGVFQDTVYKLFILKLTVGISDPVKTLCIEELRTKYNQAHSLTYYRLCTEAAGYSKPAA